MKKVIISVLALLIIIFNTQNSTFAQDNEKEYEVDSYKPNNELI